MLQLKYSLPLNTLIKKFNLSIMFRFIIFTVGIFLILSFLFGVSTVYHVIRFVFGGGKKRQKKDQQFNKKPASQDDRIITYKKKEFEISHAEDVEFEEVKDKDK